MDQLCRCKRKRAKIETISKNIENILEWWKQYI